MDLSLSNFLLSSLALNWGPCGCAPLPSLITPQFVVVRFLLFLHVLRIWTGGLIPPPPPSFRLLRVASSKPGHHPTYLFFLCLGTPQSVASFCQYCIRRSKALFPPLFLFPSCAARAHATLTLSLATAASVFLCLPSHLEQAMADIAASFFSLPPPPRVLSPNFRAPGPFFFFECQTRQRLFSYVVVPNTANAFLFFLPSVVKQAQRGWYCSPSSPFTEVAVESGKGSFLLPD